MKRVMVRKHIFLMREDVQRRMCLWVTENWPSFHLFVGRVRLQCPILRKGTEQRSGVQVWARDNKDGKQLHLSTPRSHAHNYLGTINHHSKTSLQATEILCIRKTQYLVKPPSWKKLFILRDSNALKHRKPKAFFFFF